MHISIDSMYMEAPADERLCNQGGKAVEGMVWSERGEMLIICDYGRERSRGRVRERRYRVCTPYVRR